MKKVIQRKLDKFIFLVASNITCAMTLGFGSVLTANVYLQGNFNTIGHGAFTTMLGFMAMYLYRQYKSPLSQFSDWTDSIKSRYLDHNRDINNEDKNKIIAQYMFIHAEHSVSRWSNMAFLLRHANNKMQPITAVFNNYDKKMSLSNSGEKFKTSGSSENYTEAERYQKDFYINPIAPRDEMNTFHKLMLASNNYLSQKYHNTFTPFDVFRNYELFKASLAEHFDCAIINEELKNLTQNSSLDEIFKKIDLTGQNKEQSQYINLYILEQFLSTERTITDKELQQCFKYLFKHQPFPSLKNILETEREDLFNIVLFIGEKIHPNSAINFSLIQQQLNKRGIEPEQQKYLQNFFDKKNTPFLNEHCSYCLKEIDSLLNLKYGESILEDLLFIEDKFQYFNPADIYNLQYAIQSISDCRKKVTLVRALSPDIRQKSESEIVNTLTQVQTLLYQYKNDIESQILKEIRVTHHTMKKMNASV